ncbi:unnamed protein product (mitochondrion) [Plasmodiophora brassicae]|uniref:Macro domain-containing protein n=1 Tax=Plasmodiophora brassicae TaxID=37360 RepID=A0A3P3Y7U5_PLABS|nr:unnamed protein product [Plasmodiophora brassicae]
MVDPKCKLRPRRGAGGACDRGWKMEVEAVVNAANRSLRRSRGLCEAIFQGAGVSDMEKALKPLAPCPLGGVRLTPGFKLPAKYVIHAVAPTNGGEPSEHETKALLNCYWNTLELCKEEGIKQVAFPCLGTGIVGFPHRQATSIALMTVRDWMYTDNNETFMDKVIFTAIRRTDIALYQELLPLFFRN